MDLNKINHLIATEVMGYKHLYSEYFKVYGYQTPKGFRVLFQPTTKLVDAFSVIEYMQKEWAWSLNMSNLELEVEAKVGRGYYSDTSVPLAISIAALKNFGIDYEQ